MRIRLFPAVVILASAICASAQGIHGSVRDSSGAVIPHARVTLQSKAHTSRAVTDESGQFSIPGATEGELLVSADGFAPDRRTIAGGPQRIEVVLSIIPLSQEIVVTPQRASVPVSQTDATVVRFTAESLETSGGTTLDEKLRQLPGFSLVRRTGSRAANPTSQGASLRGVAASGASRMLVLDDDVPLNDPFGGWVYWDRVPTLVIDSVELMAGGASHLYGSAALAGVMRVLEQRPPGLFEADVNMGNQNAPNGSFAAAQSFGPWTVSGSGEAFQTDGYVAVLPPFRGAVDTPLTLRFATAKARVQRSISTNGEAFASVSFFNEGRGNGTPLQANSTRLAELRTGADFGLGPGRLELRAFGDIQGYSQTFSAIAVNRSRETLTSWQRVPAQQAGGGGQWSGTIANRHTIVAGSELRVIRGVSNEINFSGPRPTASSAGGWQDFFGSYAADSIRLRRVTLTVGARIDRWSNDPTVGTNSASGVAGSPHAGLVVQLGHGFNWTASAYRSFRVPTLNELYRNFRVGNVLTVANPALSPERLKGIDSGIGFARANMLARANFFWNEVTDPVSNVTLLVTPQLITRQRQNLGSLRSRGLELSVESRLPHHLMLRGAYQFVDATVLTSPANRALVGLFIPQVPKHSMGASVSYSNQGWTFAAQARATAHQFDDDQNLLPLDAFFNLDVFAGRRIRRNLEVYFAAENALDQRYIVGRTPTPTWGTPIAFRVGTRFQLSQR